MSSSILRASAVMASGTMVSRILGLLKVMLLAYAIGSTASVSADAFANGNLLPNTLYVLLMGGMLNAVLVPQIVKAARNPDGGSGYINKIMTLVSVALIVVTVIAMLAAPFLISLLAMDWPPAQLALATAFAYWCLPQIVFYGLYTVLGEVLNARSVFGPYTWAPVVNNIIGIAGIVVFIVMFGADGTGERTALDWTPLSIGVLAGTATLGVLGQAAILMFSWHKAGIRYRPDFAWKGVGLGQTARIAGWSLATIVVMQLGGIVTNRIVSLGSGSGVSNSAMQNVWLIFMMPHSVIAVSLATAYFTRLSEWGQAGRMKEFRTDFSASVRQISLVMVLAAAAIFAAAPFISRIINFAATEWQVMQFSYALQAYVISLAAYSFLFVVQRAFYALSDTKTPFFFTTVQMAIVVLLSLTLLMAPRNMIGILFAAIWSFATIVQVLLAVWLLRRRIESIDGRRIVQSLLKYVLAAIPALGLGLLASWGAQTLVPNTNALFAILFAILVAVIVSAVYLVALRLLRSPELAELTAFSARKLGRTRS
ncbi:MULTISPECIES: murein biosynthesis integral membrane protein MurJ [unclassified Leucobacter]|uniref:murein biosynthesis integral membrane protein MurJ n=1 Tax=unclassified Leucobacter TaxID=2621730 RepID=UPI00165DEB27|nr:murein biosynthesis integral membrane protein MurJ [Leucobacter sp. CX169]MBC9925978.1 murein biosynthesis integral membrane protein MurJ [Leucobacter sp. cx-169]